MPYQTSRQPSYFSDIEYGKIAEMDFESIFIPSCRTEGYTVHDVRLIKEYQHADTDYVVDKVGGLSAPTLDEAVSNRSRYALIEVKLDSRALSTGNLPYEVVSHGSSGWCLTTKADHVWFVLTPMDGTVISRRAWVDMNMWHRYCADRSQPKRINYIQSENGIVDLLCPMTDLERYGVLKWI